MNPQIYHNPRCSKSRATLALLQEAGIEPEIIDYLNTELRKEVLLDKRLGLADKTIGDDALLDAIIANPILLNRPIVVTEKGARLCRPPELVLEILPTV